MDGFLFFLLVVLQFMIAVLVVALFGALGAYDDPQPSVVVEVCEYVRDSAGHVLSQRCWNEGR